MPHDASAPSAAAQDAAVSFQDSPGGSDPMSAALDAVLSGELGETAAVPATVAEGAPAAAAAATTETPKDGAAVEPATDIQAAQLRKGYAKLAADRQKVVELQNEARTKVANAEQWRVRAEEFDAFEKDPGAFVLAKLKPEQVNDLLGAIAAEVKSPEARRLDEIEARHQRERDEAATAAQVRKVEEWRGNVVKAITDAGETYDLVNSLGLHGDVIGVMTAYYEKHSVRDEKGNVVEPAILPWETAADAVESTRAERIEKNSKKYGKRAPVAAPAATPAVTAKDATTSEGKPPAPKRSGTPTLSTVPVAETPATASSLPLNREERERQVMAELGL